MLPQPLFIYSTLSANTIPPSLLYPTLSKASGTDFIAGSISSDLCVFDRTLLEASILPHDYVPAVISLARMQRKDPR